MTDSMQPAAVQAGQGAPRPRSIDPEAQDIEAEIRALHRPRLHAGARCPTGTCCSCGEGACDAGTALGFLDVARNDLQQARAENERIVNHLRETLIGIAQRTAGHGLATAWSPEREALALVQARLHEAIALAATSEPAGAAPPGPGHPWIPLSGSQDADGVYTRCSFEGCELPQSEHVRTLHDRQAAGSSDET